MVAGATIAALQVYRPQNVLAWGMYSHLDIVTVHLIVQSVLMTVGPGLISLVHENSPVKLWVPLYVLAGFLLFRRRLYCYTGQSRCQ